MASMLERIRRRVQQVLTRRTIPLWYFEDAWPVELAAINARRERQDRKGVSRLHPPRRAEAAPVAPKAPTRPRSPDPERVFQPGQARPSADPFNPDGTKMRPQPVPCDATGLALSGGGIRSAAVCIGAMQALKAHGRLDAIDYLSTVSGGGYAGACLSASMSERGGGAFPFGTDVSDSDAIAHIRNFSNYLLPRGRSPIRNAAEAAAIVLRGLLANAVVAATLLLAAALATRLVFPDTQALGSGSLLASTERIAAIRPDPYQGHATSVLAALTATVLIMWAIRRSTSGSGPGDTSGLWLLVARTLIVCTLAAAVVELQPKLISTAIYIHDDWSTFSAGAVKGWGSLVAALTAASAATSWFSSRLGGFLQSSQRAPGAATTMARLATHALVLVAACVVPLLLWAAYAFLAAATIAQWRPATVDLLFFLWVSGTAVSLGFGANGYTLHRFYRDRLSKAFLFKPNQGTIEPEPLDDLKLSALRATNGPYPIINAAMNVQASADANRRGRNADFFTFTPHFVGSDLTMYAATRPCPSVVPTLVMEGLEPDLDLATAMAISGAAVSANMGSSTIRALSPTLALLNIRLGYWMRNPRYQARLGTMTHLLDDLVGRFTSKLYLLKEALNLQDENSRVVFLTDGGHIENLGIYELLKRGCGTIIAVDAEADPQYAFPSLLTLERYARIDFGVRIELPWEPIADAAAAVAESIARGQRDRRPGPHCALGRIVYADGCEGTLLYFKASVTGDEKDYILDYKRRNPSFPHESTGDQFFGEEQFEMYRALGFHMVDGFFAGTSTFSPAQGLSSDATAADAFAIAQPPV